MFWTSANNFAPLQSAACCNFIRIKCRQNLPWNIVPGHVKETGDGGAPVGSQVTPVGEAVVVRVGVVGLLDEDTAVEGVGVWDRGGDAD